MGLVDADYKFIFVDIGRNGRISDEGVFSRSTLSQELESNTLAIPDDSYLPMYADGPKLPYVIVGDAAFPLKTYLLKPFSYTTEDKCQTIFNYRLSRARRTVENAFGILANRFRVLLSPIQLSH
jgi:hypothetical protein